LRSRCEKRSHGPVYEIINGHYYPRMTQSLHKSGLLINELDQCTVTKSVVGLGSRVPSETDTQLRLKIRHQSRANMAGTEKFGDIEVWRKLQEASYDI